MNQFDFGEQLLRLEEAFSPLDDKQKAVYFERLGGWPGQCMRRAVDLLLENHPYKRCPLVSEILRALKLAYQETSRATADDLQADCPRCLNMGWMVVALANERSTIQAAPCSCWRGQKIKFAEEERFRKRVRDIQPRDLGYQIDFEESIY